LSAVMDIILLEVQHRVVEDILEN